MNTNGSIDTYKFNNKSSNNKKNKDNDLHKTLKNCKTQTM